MGDQSCNRGAPAGGHCHGLPRKTLIIKRWSARSAKRSAWSCLLYEPSWNYGVEVG